MYKYNTFTVTRENVVFKKACKQEGLVVDFEFTALGMPQQNGCI